MALPATSPQGPLNTSLEYPVMTPSITSVVNGTSTAWSNPINAAVAEDGNSTSVTLNGGQKSDHLRFRDFGFKVPTSKTIDGIKVEVNCNQSPRTDAIAAFEPQIIKGGSPAGTPKYWDSVTFLPGSLTYVTYGGSTDLWGTTWTPADINSDGFGFKFDVKNQSGYSSQNAYVENARVTVYFS